MQIIAERFAVLADRRGMCGLRSDLTDERPSSEVCASELGLAVERVTRIELA
jgi:hypothetical protein